MAKTSEIIVTDDITGEPGAVPEVFGYQGLVREIDLSPASKKRFDEFMREFVEHSQPVRLDGRLVTLPTQHTNAKAGRQPKAAVAHGRKVRNWWQVQPAESGLPSYSTRGRIPEKVYAAYEEAQRR